MVTLEINIIELVRGSCAQVFPLLPLEAISLLVQTG